MIEIRAMTSSDISDVYRIETVSFRTPWSYKSLAAELSNSLAHYLVACMEGRLIGYCGMWILFDECHITNVAVDPQFRKLGVGKSLMLAAMEVGIYFDAKMMTLEVRETNRIAQKMYQSIGFEQNGYRKRYYQDTGEGALLLWNQDIANTLHLHENNPRNYVLRLESF